MSGVTLEDGEIALEKVETLAGGKFIINLLVGDGVTKVNSEANLNKLRINASGFRIKVGAVTKTLAEYVKQIMDALGGVEGLDTNAEDLVGAINEVLGRVVGAENTNTAQGAAIGGLQTQAAGLGAVVSALGTDVENLETGVSALGTDVENLETGVSALGVGKLDKKPCDDEPLINENDHKITGYYKPAYTHGEIGGLADTYAPKHDPTFTGLVQVPLIDSGDYTTPGKQNKAVPLAEINKLYDLAFDDDFIFEIDIDNDPSVSHQSASLLLPLDKENGAQNEFLHLDHVNFGDMVNKEEYDYLYDFTMSVAGQRLLYADGPAGGGYPRDHHGYPLMFQADAREGVTEILELDIFHDCFDRAVWIGI